MISGAAATTGGMLCADYVVMLAVQGDNAFGVVQLEHGFRRKCAGDDSWRARTAAELRDYADAIESGRVQLGSYNVTDYDTAPPTTTTTTPTCICGHSYNAHHFWPNRATDAPNGLVCTQCPNLTCMSFRCAHARSEPASRLPAGCFSCLDCGSVYRKKNV